MKSLPLLIFIALLLVGFAVLRRNRQRLAAGQAAAAKSLGPGADVMTTSGLYGTVVSIDSDAGAAILSIAPGVEVTWALAALRAVADLPDRYRPSSGERTGESADGRPTKPVEPGSEDRPTGEN